MTRDKIINKASSYIKNTPYANPNKFTKFQFKDSQAHAWCGAFIHYIVKQDLNCDWLEDCKNFGYVPEIVRWAKSKGYWNEDYTKARKGDLVVFNFSKEKDWYSHIGIVESTNLTNVISVDGNTNLPPKYDNNCAVRKDRNMKYVKGVVLLPYKEEDMIKEGDYVYAKEDIKLYTSIEYKVSNYTLKKNEKAWVRYTKGDNVALANPDTHEYFSSAWTNQLDKLTKEEPQDDYKKKYEEEVAKNKVLQNKINKAIEVLNG